MAFKMTLGILMRKLELMPMHCIRSFYTGLGAALVGVSLGFFLCFGKALCKAAQERLYVEEG